MRIEISFLASYFNFIAKSTADFIAKMNILFDHLNSRCSSSSNPNNLPISEESDILENIQALKKWVGSWVSTAKMKKPNCFGGLIQTLEGICELYETIREEQPYLLLGHLNTDPKENLFSMIRMNHGSYEKNPSAYIFARNLKEIMFHNFKSAEFSGYNDSECTALLENTSRHEDISTGNSDKDIDFDTSDDEAHTTGSSLTSFISKSGSKELRQFALSYYAGFAAF